MFRSTIFAVPSIKTCGYAFQAEDEGSIPFTRSTIEYLQQARKKLRFLRLSIKIGI